MQLIPQVPAEPLPEPAVAAGRQATQSLGTDAPSNGDIPISPLFDPNGRKVGRAKKEWRRKQRQTKPRISHYPTKEAEEQDLKLCSQRMHHRSSQSREMAESLNSPRKGI